jgi:hypothetical protein
MPIQIRHIGLVSEQDAFFLMIGMVTMCAAKLQQGEISGFVIA